MATKFLGILFCALALSACVSTSDAPIAPGVTQIDVHGSGALFAGKTGAVALCHAAAISKRDGFPFFRLENVQTASGSEVYGVASNSYGNGFGTSYGGFGSYSFNSMGFATPLRRAVSDESATVVGLSKNAPGAWRTDDILAKCGNG